MYAHNDKVTNYKHEAKTDRTARRNIRIYLVLTYTLNSYKNLAMKQVLTISKDYNDRECNVTTV